MKELKVGERITITLEAVEAEEIPVKDVSLITENLVENGDNTTLVVPMNVQTTRM